MRPAADFLWGRSRISGPGSDFLKLEIGRRVLYLKRYLVPNASAIIARLGDLRSSTAQGAGNRASGYVIHLDGGAEIFVRRARRGGLMRFLVNDLYFGVRPRPLRELAVAAEAYRRDGRIGRHGDLSRLLSDARDPRHDAMGVCPHG